MNSKLLILAGLAAVAVTSIAVFLLTSRGGEQTGESEETVTEFAPVRAYAGLSIDQQGLDGSGRPAVVSRVGAPSVQAGLRQSDVVAKVSGVTVDNAHELFVEIEKKRPGDSVDIEVHRYDFRPAVPNAPLPEPERMTLKLDLVEEPPPGTDYIWVPWTGIKDEDQARLGGYLADITQPLALHFGVEEPGGALVHSPLPIWIFAGGPVKGDVIRSFDGKRVTSLKQLQTLVDNTPEDKAIKLGVQRGDQTLEFTLDSLGPNVAHCNHLPAPARFRLQAALEHGELHPDHLPLIASSYQGRDTTPGQSAGRNGTIKRLSGSSITIELYETGTKWTQAILPATTVAGYGAPNGLADLNVGEFVQVLTRDGETAFQISSRSAPLRPP
jgi:PDZ domain